MHSIHAYCSAHSCRQRFPYFFDLEEANASSIVLPSACLSDVKMTADETLHTKQVAHERIQVEIAVRAIKLFKWLSGRTIRAKQVDLIDPVLRIAKHITNLVRHPFIPKDAPAKARSLFGKSFISAHALMFNFTAFTDQV